MLLNEANVPTACAQWNKVSSVYTVMGRDDSWPATVPSVVPSYSRTDSNLISPAALRSDVLA